MSELTQPSPFGEGRDHDSPQRDKGSLVVKIVVVGLSVFILVALFLPTVGSRTPSKRSQCKFNLMQIGLALSNYHDVFGSFPPAYIPDEYGRPMHSWRVLILPWLDQGPLYNQYRFDEPWDGPNNRKLHGAVVAVYQCLSDPADSKSAEKNFTSYVAVIGPNTMWPGSEPVKLGDVTDGTAKTLMVVEVANSGIHWMEPRDLHVLQMAPTINSSSGQGISSKHVGGAQGLLANGSARFFSDKLPAATLRDLLTRRGGENVGEF